MRTEAFAELSLALALLVFHPNVLGSPPNPCPPSSSGYYVTGKVTSSQGAPVRSVWVMVYSGTNRAGMTLTGDDGGYYIGGLGDGIYTIFVRRQPSSSNLFSGSISLTKNTVYNIKLP